ncbi:MAG: glycosyltransferase [Solirubrobacterales bacterium]
MPAVAIAMRTRSRPSLLRRALLDVLAQSSPDWHLSLLNNGGDAASVDALVAEFADRFAGRITVTHAPEHLAMEAATNEAVRAAPASRYVNVHDDDDTWDPEFLRRTIARLDESDDDVAGVAARSDYVLESIEADGSIKQLERRPHNPNLTYLTPADVLAANPFPPISFLFRRSVYDALGGFDERYTLTGDWDMVIRILRDHQISVIETSLAQYRHRSASTSGTQDTNSVADLDAVAANEAMVRDKFVREALDADRIELAHLAAAITPVDRDTLALAKELRQRVYDLQLLAGELDQRLKEVHGFAIRHEVPLQRLNKLFDGLARLRHPFRRP